MNDDFFMRAAVEWVTIADAVRVVYPTATGSFHKVVTSLYREAAWCHILFQAGRYSAAMTQLQAIYERYERLFGERIPHDNLTQTDGTELFVVATEFFRRFRSAAVKRYSAAFDSRRVCCPA